MIVTPKKIAVRHNGHRYTAGEEFEIDRADYERIAQHVDVVSEQEKPARRAGRGYTNGGVGDGGQ